LPFLASSDAPFDQLAQTAFSLADINEAFGAAERREVVRASIVP
jgi:Zn-dependent alcohol dehydrogenase